MTRDERLSDADAITTYPVAVSPNADTSELARALIETCGRMPPRKLDHAVWVAGVGMLPRLAAVAAGDDAAGRYPRVLFGVPPGDPVVWVLKLPVVFTDRCGADEITLWDRRPKWASSPPAVSTRA